MFMSYHLAFFFIGKLIIFLLYFIELNRWPVPTPCWRHPDCFDEYESDDEEKFVPKSGNLSYFGGRKTFLY